METWIVFMLLMAPDRTLGVAAYSVEDEITCQERVIAGVKSTEAKLAAEGKDDWAVSGFCVRSDRLLVKAP